MAKKKNISKIFGFDDRTTAARVLDTVRVAKVEDVIEMLLREYIYDPLDENFRRDIEEYLSEIYDGIYLVRCSKLENQIKDAESGILNIRFVGFDQDFIAKVELTRKEKPPLQLDIFLKHD